MPDPTEEEVDVNGVHPLGEEEAANTELQVQRNEADEPIEGRMEPRLQRNCKLFSPR